MRYSISRLEYNRNHEGEIVSIFLAVNVSDGQNGTCVEHWLSQEEQMLVLADEANLKPMLERYYAEAELKMENEIATRPMPSICPLQEKVVDGQPTKKEILEAMVKIEDILIQKTAIVEEKAQIEEDRLQAIKDSKSVEEVTDLLNEEIII